MGMHVKYAWNSLPLEIKTAPSLNVFTEKLKTELYKNHIHIW